MWGRNSSVKPPKFFCTCYLFDFVSLKSIIIYQKWFFLMNKHDFHSCLKENILGLIRNKVWFILLLLTLLISYLTWQMIFLSHDNIWFWRIKVNNFLRPNIASFIFAQCLYVHEIWHLKIASRHLYAYIHNLVNFPY